MPHDYATLIGLAGGKDKDDDAADAAFVSRLNFFHTSGLADISNEPVFLTAYLYHYAGRPGLSARRIRTYVPGSFTSGAGGLPGNDDSGSMGSFLWFSAVGLFPVAGQDVYLISAPFFEEVAVRHPVTGRTARVRVVEGWGGGDGEDGDGGVYYVQGVRVNGEVWTRSWVGHEFFAGGWSMELVLGVDESDWGTAVEDRPPSYGGGGAMFMGA